MTVSGWTRTSAVRHPAQTRAGMTQSNRTVFASRTRFDRVRCSVKLVPVRGEFQIVSGSAAFTVEMRDVEAGSIADSPFNPNARRNTLHRDRRLIEPTTMRLPAV